MPYIDRLVFWLPTIVGVLYIITSLAFIYKREPAWALVYFAYALANIGLIWAST